MARETISRGSKLPPKPYFNFRGRKKEIEQVYHRLINHHKNWLLALTGAGGVGKTSVAFEVANQVLSQSSREFDDVIWISAKNYGMFGVERRELTREFRSVEDLYSKILLVFFDPPEIHDLSLKEKVRMVHQCLEGTRFLFVLDNLEVFSQDELDQIVQFVSEAPLGHKFLLTSRHSLRVHDMIEVPGMDYPTFTEYSEDVMSVFELAPSLRDDVRNNLRELFRITTGNPLYLKFFLAQVQKGRAVSDIIARRGTDSEQGLREYCFDTTLSQLTEFELMAMHALASVAKDAVSLHELAYTTNIGKTELGRTMDKLSSVSLVTTSFGRQGEPQFSINPFLGQYLLEESRVPLAERHRLEDRSRLFSAMLVDLPDEIRINFILGESLEDSTLASFNLSLEVLRNSQLEPASAESLLQDAVLLYPGNYLVPLARYLAQRSTPMHNYGRYGDLNRTFSALNIRGGPDLVGMYVWKALLYLFSGKYGDVEADLNLAAVRENEAFPGAEPLIGCIRACALHQDAWDWYNRQQYKEHDRAREAAEVLFSQFYARFMERPYFLFLKRMVHKSFQKHRKFYKSQTVSERDLRPFTEDFPVFKSLHFRGES